MSVSREDSSGTASLSCGWYALVDQAQFTNKDDCHYFVGSLRCFRLLCTSLFHSGLMFEKTNIPAQNVDVSEV